MVKAGMGVPGIRTRAKDQQFGVDDYLYDPAMMA
jgi:hypothetical protein